MSKPSRKPRHSPLASLLDRVRVVPDGALRARLLRRHRLVVEKHADHTTIRGPGALVLAWRLMLADREVARAPGRRRQIAAATAARWGGPRAKDRAAEAAFALAKREDGETISEIARLLTERRGGAPEATRGYVRRLVSR